MTSTAVILRSVVILASVASLPSSLGFQLPNDSRLPLPSAAQASGSRRHSPFLLRQRPVVGLPLSGLWGGIQGSKENEESDNGDEVNAEGGTEEEDLIPTENTSPVEIVATDSPDVAALNSSSIGSEKSLWVLLNEIGNNFKAMAQRATVKGSESDSQSKKIVYATKACVYYTLFILYRAYRGFFVLLPATFLQVYRKMEGAMNSGNLSLEQVGFTESGQDPANKTTTWRTKLTVSILTTVITASYIIGGTLKMATRFLRTIAKTSDVSKSFEAAADEALDFETRISSVGKVNGGEDAGSPSGLAP